MQFKDIINQEGVKEQLVELVQNNRLSHALLFLGKEGNGALSMAIALAQYITCERTTDHGRRTRGREQQGTKNKRPLSPCLLTPDSYALPHPVPIADYWRPDAPTTICNLQSIICNGMSEPQR